MLCYDPVSLSEVCHPESMLIECCVKPSLANNKLARLGLTEDSRSTNLKGCY